MKKLVFLTMVMLTLGHFSNASVWAQTVDCTVIGQRVAAEQAGQLTKATAAVQNGQDVCVVVVLVPGKGGDKPRRVEIAVPAN